MFNSFKLFREAVLQQVDTEYLKYFLNEPGKIKLEFFIIFYCGCQCSKLRPPTLKRRKRQKQL